MADTLTTQRKEFWLQCGKSALAYSALITFAVYGLLIRFGVRSWVLAAVAGVVAAVIQYYIYRRNEPVTASCFGPPAGTAAERCVEDAGRLGYTLIERTASRIRLRPRKVIDEYSRKDETPPPGYDLLIEVAGERELLLTGMRTAVAHLREGVEEMHGRQLTATPPGSEIWKREAGGGESYVKPATLFGRGRRPNR